MNPQESFYDVPDNEIPAAATLVVNGNVNVGKNKGQGLLLFTPDSLFAFRVKMGAATTGAAAGGLVGALIGKMIDSRRAKNQQPPEHLDDPEIQRLEKSVFEKVEKTELLAKFALRESLHIECTKMGFKFDEGGEVVVYQGMGAKKKVIRFLEEHDLQVR